MDQRLDMFVIKKTDYYDKEGNNVYELSITYYNNHPIVLGFSLTQLEELENILNDFFDE